MFLGVFENDASCGSSCRLFLFSCSDMWRTASLSLIFALALGTEVRSLRLLFSFSPVIHGRYSLESNACNVNWSLITEITSPL